MLKNNLLKFVLSGLVLGAVFLAGDAAAQTTGGTVTLVSPLQGDLGIAGIIEKVIGVIFWLGVMVCPITIIWGAFEIATAAGDQTKISQGRQIILYSVVGLTIIAISSALANLVNTTLTTAP